MTNIRSVLLIVFLWTLSMFCHGQSLPSVNPSADITPPGEEQLTDITTYSGSAPLSCRFKARPSDTGGWDAFYEWRFYLDKDRTTPYLKRYEEETSLEISKSGTHYIQLYAIFVHDKDTITFTEEDISPITITVYESKLEMPNAFSPNNDGINDIYKPKAGYQSIVKFHATIFNRWGQKLYEWDNPAEGWDGKSHGKEMKQGVYFCLVKAKGADGRDFNIKTDVNLLRGYTERTNNE
ncbi:gliding motility-associated C-terminal domain-containing protein [Prevotella sp. A2931]|uniref:Gliding motility-associated C-terminal domain-containing protein n=1 Tax=Prevotella illustrans TaxID=2800387 RepID=A0ABS3M3J0_9BACT|nr:MULTISPECIES: gliding motility-associated C-terminal domain-containing protein [Prevotella]MBO1362741.1 gliding motility-associated C-terminal domain-containing protein [Prevotella illustrans]PTL25737.1 gliding motility protein [Prevotella sp. oral taxon 820]